MRELPYSSSFPPQAGSSGIERFAEKSRQMVSAKLCANPLYAEKHRAPASKARSAPAQRTDSALLEKGMALGAGWKRQAAARKPEVAKVNSRNAARRRSAAFFAGS